MCGSMVDIQSATAEIKQGIKKETNKQEERKKPQDKNIMVAAITSIPVCTDAAVTQGCH